MKLFKIATLLIAIVLLSCKGNESGEMMLLDSGYEYKIHNKSGNTPGNPGDYVEFDLDLVDIEGNVLQSMRDAPQMPQLQIPKTDQDKQNAMGNPLIGLLGKLGVGDSATVYIPMDSIPRPTPDMEGLDQIAYTLVARSIMSEAEYKADQEAKIAENQKLMEEGQKMAEEKKVYCEQLLKDYQAGKLNDKVTTLESGLKIVLLEEGTGDNAANGNDVDVHYYGMLKDGTQFDNSFARGKAFQFKLGQGMVIQGWDQGIAELNKGAKALLDIPFDLGYGAAGSPPTIPAEAQLFFYVELVDFK